MEEGEEVGRKGAKAPIIYTSGIQCYLNNLLSIIRAKPGTEVNSPSRPKLLYQVLITLNSGSEIQSGLARRIGNLFDPR